MKFSVLTRKTHAWGAIIIAAPLALVIVTGLLLQLKKQIGWVQPAELRGSTGDPAMTMEKILETCRAIPELEVRTWADIDRIDFRPSRGMLKVKALNHYEVQLDSRSGDVLQVAYRRSDIIESLHDGSWFGNAAKLWLFLPVGIVLLGLWCSGVYLFFYPRWVKARRPVRGMKK